jgi:hypothetical protein
MEVINWRCWWITDEINSSCRQWGSWPPEFCWFKSPLQSIFYNIHTCIYVNVDIYLYIYIYTIIKYHKYINIYIQSSYIYIYTIIYIYKYVYMYVPGDCFDIPRSSLHKFVYWKCHKNPCFAWSIFDREAIEETESMENQLSTSVKNGRKNVT